MPSGHPGQRSTASSLTSETLRDSRTEPRSRLGEGVDVYIINSGVNAHVHAFEHRVKQCTNISGISSLKDTRDHGTRVASIIGSSQYGVAKKATLWACKVDPKKAGSVAEAIKAAIAKDKTNQSLLGYKGADVDAYSLEALHAAEQAGISIVVSAGNDGSRLSGSFILTAIGSELEHVIVVGAVDQHNTRAQFAIGGTNYGRLVTIYARGKDLEGIDKRGAVVTGLEGASFACAYVTGIIALYYGEEGVAMNPKQAKKTLLHNADKGVLRGLTNEDANLLASDGWLKAKEEAQRRGRKAVHRLPYLVPPADC